MKTKLQLIFLLSIFAFSCRKEYIIDYPPLNPTLIVNCLFSPDTVFNIHISRLQNINDTTSAIVENARVTLYEDENFFDTAVFNSSTETYKSNRKPQVGKTYSVRVEAEGFPAANAEDKVPDSISIDSANVYIAAYYDSWEEHKLELVELYFKNTREENYYEVISYSDQYIESVDYHIYNLPYGITSLDPIILAEGILDKSKYQPVLVFSDKLLDENAKVTFMPFLQLGGSSYISDSYTLLRNISKDYYLFRKKWYKYLQTNAPAQMNGIAELSNMSFISDPTEAYTNVENGLGIFAAYTACTKLMQIKN